MKKLTFLLLGSLILGACSKTVKEIHDSPGVEKDTQKTSISHQGNEVESLKNLMLSEAPNIALGELLAKTIPKEQRQDVKNIISSLSADEAKELITQVQKQNANIRQEYLFHGQKYQHNKAFLTNVVGNDIAVDNLSLANQLRVSVFSYVKNKTLDEIVSTYSKRSAQLAEELSEEIAFDIGGQNPELASRIESAVSKDSKEKAIEFIQNSKEVVEKVDKYFKSSNLNENEQYVTLVGAVIAGGIYMQVKDKAGFKNIVEQGKKIVRDIKTFERKAKEATVLIKTLGDHLDSTAKNMNDFSDGISESKNDFDQMYKEAKVGAGNPSNVHSKRIFDFLYNKVIKGKDVKADGTNTSILSKQTKINASITKSVTAVGNVADNLANIINTTNKLSALFGIKPSKDLQKVLVKAQKVAEVVGTVKNVMVAYAAGGPLGAMGAFSSSPMLASMMGGGGGDTAKLDEISRKLDIVIENQRKMMEMQVETMKMIKDLALMIDRYHQDQMVALAELRDINLVSMEINKLQLNKDIRSCERMVDYPLKSVWNSFNFGSESTQSINHLKLINAKFNSSISSLTDIRRIVTSVEERGYENCQTGIAEAFSGNTSTENPIRAIYSSTEDDNLTKFEREKYLPLLSSLAHFTQTSSYNSIPLHFPTSNIQSLKLKIPYVDYAKDEPSIGEEAYDIDTLISVKALERYVSNLIILHPILEVDKSIWFGSFENIVSTYLVNSNIGSNQNTRSVYFLDNALKLTQSAIAQEALLSGEPILHKLHNYNKEILSNKKCTDVLKDEPYTKNIPFLCAIRNNTLLMKNFVMFSLHYQNEVTNDLFARYEDAYKRSDLATLAKLFNTNLVAENLKLEKNGSDYDIVVNLNGLNDRAESIEAIKLPTPEALREGEILYSENMPRLLLMQNLIIENLEKVAPVNRTYNGKNGLVDLLLVAN